MRKLFIAGNWKMNKTVSESVDLVRKITLAVKGITAVDILVAPPFTSLTSVHDIVKDTQVKLGAQNLFWEESGAFTGEISGSMLKNAGCEYVIIGHSERRQYFNETDETVNKRIKAALKIGLKPIVCIGEKLGEREKGVTEQVLDTQLSGGFKEISNTEMEKVTIAYEPVWAIGTGKTATPDMANSAHQFIREKITDMFNKKLADHIRIQYGGSVKPDNAGDLLSQEHIDGALVGGASLEVDKFTAIIKAGLL